MLLSIIIPVLNDSDHIDRLLQQLSSADQEEIEIIVVDGGSNDDTTEIASRYTEHVLTSVRGRAAQMNAGAEVAKGDIYWFLHADSQCSIDLITELLQVSKQLTGWGFFTIRLSGKNFMFRVIEFMMNQRSRITKIATGDQGIFINKNLFYTVNGFAEIPLMEDIAITRKLKSKRRPLCIKQYSLTTSSRRWEEQGILRTVLLMWRLRLAYFLGADPERLVKQYY